MHLILSALYLFRDEMSLGVHIKLGLLMKLIMNEGIQLNNILVFIKDLKHDTMTKLLATVKHLNGVNGDPGRGDLKPIAVVPVNIQ